MILYNTKYTKIYHTKITCYTVHSHVASNQAPSKEGGLEGIACACVKIPRKLGDKKCLVNWQFQVGVLNRLLHLSTPMTASGELSRDSRAYK